MPHIELIPGIPGIRGPMAFSPETAKPINDLANVLMRANALFCLCNRYVDGLATTAPVNDPDFYRQRAAGVVAGGYRS